MKFARSLFGYKPKEVKNQIMKLENEHQEKVTALNTEIDKIQGELHKAQEKREDLQERLNVYSEKERFISEIMITAQIHAQRIEQEAKDQARQMIQKAEEELAERQRELEALRIKAVRFKEEFRGVLDNYRISLERVRDNPDDTNFTPTLITTKNRRQHVSN